MSKALEAALDIDAAIQFLQEHWQRLKPEHAQEWLDSIEKDVGILKAALTEAQKVDVWDGKLRRLDDGPDLPKSCIMAAKKPYIIKTMKEGLSSRAAARVFDVSHEYCAQLANVTHCDFVKKSEG